MAISEGEKLAGYSSSGLYYEAYGNGEPLLYLHGYGMGIEVLGASIGHLSRNFQLVVPELRGHGRSSHMEPATSIGQMAGDVLALMDELGHETFFVSGYSMGGAVAQAVVLAAPLRVRRLALGGTFAHKRLNWHERVPIWLAILGVWLVGGWGLAIFMLPLFIREKAVSRTHLGLMRKVMRAQKRRHLASCLRAILKWDSRNLLHEITIPTLILHAEADSVVPVSHGRLLSSRIKHAVLCTVPKAGHKMIYTHAGEMSDAIRAFFFNETATIHSADVRQLPSATASAK